MQSQVNQPVPDSQRLPWEREQGWAGTFLSTSLMIIFAPSRTFALRPAGAYYKPWLYVFIAGLMVSLFLTFMHASINSDASVNAMEEVLADLVPEMLLGLVGLAGLAVAGWLVHYFAKFKATAQAPLWATWRVLAYSHAVMLLLIPIGLLQMGLLAAGSNSGNELAYTLMMLTLPVFLAVIAYGIYLQCVGIDSVHGCGRRQAFLILVQAFFALGLMIGGLVLVLVIVGGGSGAIGDLG